MSCNNSVLNLNDLKYIWKITDLARKAELLKSTSRDPSRYLLPSYALQAHEVYTVTLVVNYLNATVSTSVQVRVNTGHVKAVITGNDQQMMLAGNIFRVDGSQSYDEDKENLKGLNAGLSFSWSCLRLLANSKFSSCSNLFNQELFAASSHSPILYLKANESAVNTKAKITLLVKDPVSGRNDSTSIQLTVLPSLYPVISLSSNADFTRNNRINPSQSLQLKANISFTTPGIHGNLTWLSPSNLNLSSIPSIPVTRSIVTAVPLKLAVYFALPGNYLVAGQSYAFGLRCQLEGNIQVTNFITVSVNIPPSSGKFVVTPSFGTAYLEPFALTCSNWVDTDLPLSYQFSFLSLTGRTLITKGLTPLSFSSTVLPDGQKENNQLVTCQADIYDSMNANTTTFMTTQVHPLLKANISQLVRQNIDPTLAIDLDDLIKGVNIASSLLNQPNCSLSPNCTALNRFPCLSTSHTCGPCQNSFFSSNPGDGNELCVKDSTNLVINNHPKECYLNCSARGDCMYYSHISGKIVEKCFTGDLSCYTTCSCSEGYKLSSYCEISDSETKLFIQLRELVVDRIVSNTKLQDPTAQAVSGWMNSLLEIAQAPNQISENALSSLLELSNRALTTVQSEGYDSATSLSKFIDATDSLSAVIPYTGTATTTRKARRLDTKSDYSQQVTDSLRNYSQLIVRTMVPGQAPVKTAKDHFKIYIQNLEPSQDNTIHTSRKLETGSNNCNLNETVILPQLLLEKSLKIKATAITVPTCGNAMNNGNSMQLSVVSLSSKLYGSQSSFTSNPLTVSLSSLPCSHSDPDSCRIDVAMRSDNEGAGTITVQSINRTIECIAGDLTNHTVSCPNNHKNYTVTCRGKLERILFHCPSSALTPTCSGVFAGNSVQNIGCQLKSSGKESISCSCPFSSTSTTGESPHITVVALLTSVEENFLTTIFSASKLNEDSLARSWEAIVTVTLFIGGIIVLMLFSVFADKKANKKVSMEEKLIETAKVHSVYQQKLQQSQQQGRSRSERDNEIDEKINLFALAEESLPQLLSSTSTANSWKEKIWTEEKKFHRWLGIVYYFSAIFPRILRVVSLASNIIIMLFIQSLTYNYTHGDDGSCQLLTTEEECVAPRSYYGTGGSRCSWQTTSTTTAGSTATEEGECSFIQPENSIEIMLFVAVFSGLVSAPFAVFIDWIIHKILAAPEINELLMMNLGKEKEISSKKNQFMSVLPVPNANNIPIRNGSSFSFASLKRTLFSRRHSSMTVQQYQQFIDKDYRDLLHELLEYRQTTVQDKELVQEIDRLWGFTLGAHHRAWEDEPAVTQHIAAVSHRSNNIRGKGLFRQCEDFVTSAFVDSQSISKSLQQELGTLYYQLEKEKVKFELLKTETAKSKRLLFLFQKDLTPGITGEILESKEQRGNDFLEPVSARMKIIGWIFLGGLDLGMLFYVFLFAVSQDSHRQVAWGRSLGIYLFLDIVLISTVMVIFMHVLLPSLIMRDVGKIKKKMIESIERFYETLEKDNKIEANGNGKTERKSTEDDEEEDEEKNQLHRKKDRTRGIRGDKKTVTKLPEKDDTTVIPVFNAAKYLFLSHRLASVYPDVKASQIILSYTSPWPKQDYQHITNVKSDYSGRYSAITRSISIIVVFFLTNLLATPIAIQDMILQITTTAMMGYTLFVHLQLYYIYPVLVMIPTVFVCAVGLAIRYYYLHSAKKEEPETNDHNNAQPVVAQTHLTTRRQSLQQGIQLASQLQNNLLRTEERKKEEYEDDEEEDQMSLPSFSSNSLSEKSYYYTRKNNIHKKGEQNKPCDDENDYHYQLSGKCDSLLDSIPSNNFFDDDEEMNFSDNRSGKYEIRNIRKTAEENMREEEEDDDDIEDDVDMLFNLDSSSVSSIRSQNN
jgi:hypothetical protein